MCSLRRTGLSRRAFIKGSVAGLAGLPLSSSLSALPVAEGTSKVALIKTDDRRVGVREALSLFNYAPVSGKQVLIKPNFNTADPTPGSTHNDTLAALIKIIRDQGAAAVTVGDRSGPVPTAKVLADKGIPALAAELDFKMLNFSELPESQWIRKAPRSSHWREGFMFARPVLEAEFIISTCCLKTHQYGGVFTMSLKNSVGMVQREQMKELHGSPDMRRMIAEINTAYRPHLIVLDGIEAFVDEGPMKGPIKTANVFLAGVDRVAVDAVGLAILKDLGANEWIMGRGIFAQEQIERAVELGLGIRTPEQIEFLTPDRESRLYAERLQNVLGRG